MSIMWVLKSLSWPKQNISAITFSNLQVARMQFDNSAFFLLVVVVVVVVIAVVVVVVAVVVVVVVTVVVVVVVAVAVVVVVGFSFSCQQPMVCGRVRV